MTHPIHTNEPKLEKLIEIRDGLYKLECTPEVAKKIEAVESQIKRHKAVKAESSGQDDVSA